MCGRADGAQVRAARSLIWRARKLEAASLYAREEIVINLQEREIPQLKRAAEVIPLDVEVGEFRHLVQDRRQLALDAVAGDVQVDKRNRRLIPGKQRLRIHMVVGNAECFKSGQV